MRILQPLALLILLVFLTTCNSVVTDPPRTDSIIPLDSILVDIPDPLSDYVPSGKQAAPNSIDGAEIYEALRIYIGFAEESADLVRKILGIIHAANLSGPREFEIEGDDGRTKEVRVTKNDSADGQVWDFKLEINNKGGNLAFQFFWNRNPFEAIAVLDLYEMDDIEHQNLQGMLLEIKVNDNKPAGIQRQMLVQIVNNPKEPGDDGYVNNLKMLVTKAGDIVEIFGNSNHPDLTLIDTTMVPGRSYSFVGRGSEMHDVGIVKLGIPPSGLNDMSNFFETHSVDTVFKSEILAMYPSINPDTLDKWLENARVPAYFDSNGFISAGPNPPTLPGVGASFYDLTGYLPFIPKEVRDLQLGFY